MAFIDCDKRDFADQEFDRIWSAVHDSYAKLRDIVQAERDSKATWLYVAAVLLLRFPDCKWATPAGQTLRSESTLPVPTQDRIREQLWDLVPDGDEALRWSVLMLAVRNEDVHVDRQLRHRVAIESEMAIHDRCQEAAWRVA